MRKVKKYSIIGSEEIHKTKLIIDEEGIVDVECDCIWGKNNKRAWRDARTICKHSKQAIRLWDMERKNPKRKLMNIGKKKLSKKERKVLIGLTHGKCQKCGEKATDIHRIKRGNNGGRYTPNNILILCNKCHRLLHPHEKGTNSK